MKKKAVPRVDHLKSLNLNVASLVAKTGVITSYLETIAMNTAPGVPVVPAPLPMSKDGDCMGALKYTRFDLSKARRVDNYRCVYDHETFGRIPCIMYVCYFHQTGKDNNIIAVYTCPTGGQHCAILDLLGRDESYPFTQKLYNL